MKEKNTGKSMFSGFRKRLGEVFRRHTGGLPAEPEEIQLLIEKLRGEIASKDKELRQIQDALTSLGFSDDLSRAFKDVYQLRSEQVMHAQREQTEISRDDVVKIKACLDGIIYKLYQPVWNDGLSRLEEEGSDADDASSA